MNAIDDVDLLDIFARDIGKIELLTKNCATDTTSPHDNLALSFVSIGERPLLHKKEDIRAIVGDIASHKQEHVVCLTLDTSGHLINRRLVTIGLLTSSLIHPREVFAGAVADRAAAIIIAHNHPSGVAEPSEGDIEATQQLAAAGQILGIWLRDHIIICEKATYSFAGEGLLLDWNLYKDST